jgi:hypothetical protein
VNCPYCDAALTRCAVLAHALNRIALEAHAAGKHAGTWDTCKLQPCQRATQAVQTAGLESQRD